MIFVCAFLPAKERLIETLEMGQAFIRAVNSSYNLSLPGGLAFPVAVGAAAQKMDLDLRITLQSYLQSFAANLISVGVRTIPIGQQAGQDCLVDLTPTFKKVSKEIMNSPIGDFGSATTLSDIMAMKHEDSESRIYRT